MLFRALLLGLSIFAISQPASAAPPACSATTEGAIVYNKDHKAMQFCNGTGWVAMSGVFGGGGGGITALTGEITASGTGSVAATIADNAITNVKMADDAVGLAELSATGTPSATTYLRGDNTWATISTGLPALTNASIWVGNGTNVATAVAMSGDATLSNAGVLNLAADSVTSAEIAADTIAAGDIATSAVTTTEILDSTVASADIALDTIVAADIAAGAVDSSEIATGAVDLAHLSATGAPGGTTYLRGDNTWATVATGLPTLSSASIWVGNGTNVATAVAMSGDATLSNAGALNLAVDSVTSAEIAADTIAAGDIATGAVTTAEILDSTVASADIAADTIIAADIAAGAVDSSEIATGAVDLAHLSATGTASATTYLRGDNTWTTVSGADNLGTHIATQTIVSDTTNTDDLGTTAIRWKDGWFAGTVTGGTFAGSGASLTALPAANLTGTLPAISGANLTSLNATNLASGTVAAARMPALTGDVTMTAGTTATALAASVVTTTEILDSTIASADIAADTITAADLAADAVGIAELAATGTPDATTFLRGDNTWAVPAGGGGGGSADYQAFTASGTWTKPASGNVVFVECWGGGGSGARHSTSATYRGGGGGGGYNSRWVPLAVIPGNVTVTIGAGGAAVSSNTVGNNGGNTTFGSYLTAYGGAGGELGGGGGGGGPLGAASSNNPGAPIIASGTVSCASNGSYTTTYSYPSYYQGQGAYEMVCDAGGLVPSQSAVHHGGGGGGGTYSTAAAYVNGGRSMFGGGGGGGRNGTTNGTGGASTAGGAGGAGGAPGVAGTQPGGGGGASSTTSGAGGAGACRVTTF